MGRRAKHAPPQVRNHKGYARLRILGVEYHLGPFGSKGAIAEANYYLGEFYRSGGTCAPAKRPRHRNSTATLSLTPAMSVSAAGHESVWGDRSGQPASPLAPPPAHAPRTTEDTPATSRHWVTREPHAATALPDYEYSKTVGEMALIWLQEIEQNHCARGKRVTGVYYKTRQAINALEDYWDYPVASFGPRLLTEVQKKLASTPRVTSRSKDPNKQPKKKPRSRKGVNETIRNVLAFFAFCEQLEEIPPGKTAQLRIVGPLKKNTNLPVAPCGRKSRVDDAVLAATLPHLPESVADMVRLARRLGCRPSEIRAMKLADIDRQPLDQYKGCWIWRPSQFKVDWLEDPLPRQIAIEPASQVILAPWVAQVERTPTVPVFSPLRLVRQPRRGRTTDAACHRRAQGTRKRNPFYSKELFQSEISRGTKKAGVSHWTAGQIRHTRLQEARDKGGIEAAQAVGGHSNINQTEHYAGILLGTAIKAALSIAAPEL